MLTRRSKQRKYEGKVSKESAELTRLLSHATAHDDARRMSDQGKRRQLPHSSLRPSKEYVCWRNCRCFLPGSLPMCRSLRSAVALLPTSVCEAWRSSHQCRTYPKSDVLLHGGSTPAKIWDAEAPLGCHSAAQATKARPSQGKAFQASRRNASQLSQAKRWLDMG